MPKSTMDLRASSGKALKRGPPNSVKARDTTYTSKHMHVLLLQLGQTPPLLLLVVVEEVVLAVLLLLEVLGGTLKEGADATLLIP